jgi:hypothetical protein
MGITKVLRTLVHFHAVKKSQATTKNKTKNKCKNLEIVGLSFLAENSNGLTTKQEYRCSVDSYTYRYPLFFSLDQFFVKQFCHVY